MNLEQQTDSFYDDDGKLRYFDKTIGEIKNNRKGGESGESGGNTHERSFYGWRKNGENVRNSPHDSPISVGRPIYPVDALGALTDVCTYMRDEMQLPVETAGQSLLGAASLLTQGLYDVETLAGTSPISLYLKTVSESGDGKSSADSVALKRVSESDREAHVKYENDIALWGSLSKREKDGGRQPVAPYRLVKSGTIQGIIRSFKDGVSSQGSFTAEAASMLSGWGMSTEQVSNTLAGLNGLWDGGEISTVKQGDGRTQLYDKRFCCHWLVQPSAARESLNNDLFASIGLWPRFLIAWPEHMKPRKYKQFNARDSSVVKEYWRRCDALLTERCTIPEGGRKPIALSDEARGALIKFWEKMEVSRDKANELNHVKSFCVRGGEQVCRIAGTLAAFENHSNGVINFTITIEHVKNAIKLFAHSLDTWQWIFGGREDAEHQLWADTLHEWMLKQPDKKASETSMLKLAPRTIRSRHKRDIALSILQSKGAVRNVVELMRNGGERVIHNEWRVLS